MKNVDWEQTHYLMPRIIGEEPRKGDQIRYRVGDELHDAEVKGKRRVKGKVVFEMSDGAKVGLFQITGAWYRKPAKSSGSGDGLLVPFLVMSMFSGRRPW